MTTGIQNAVADCQTHKAVHDKYLKIGWKARQAAFAESHKDELDSFNKAFRYLKKQGVDLNVNLDSLQAEYSKLQATYAELAGQLAAAKEEFQLISLQSANLFKSLRSHETNELLKKISNASSTGLSCIIFPNKSCNIRYRNNYFFFVTSKVF